VVRSPVRMIGRAVSTNIWLLLVGAAVIGDLPEDDLGSPDHGGEGRWISNAMPLPNRSATKVP